MDSTAELEEVLAAALKLAPKERLRLAERVVSSVERELETPISNKQSGEEHWGRSLNALLATLDMSEWEEMDIDDPVEWVNSIRRKEENRLKPYWDGDK